MTVVSLELGPTPVIGEPRTIADSIVQPSPFLDDPSHATRFAVSPDGGRLHVQLSPEPSLRQLTLFQRWKARIGATRR